MSALASMAFTLERYGARSAASLAAAAAGGGGSKSGRMRRALAEGPLTARELCVVASLPYPNLVYGLLKVDLQTDRILVREGRFTLNPLWVPVPIQKAIALLEKNGYRVERLNP